MRYQRLFVCVALAAVVGACSSANPAEPSGSATATVNGSIVPAGGSSSAATAGVNSGSISAASTAPPGLLVSVAGTAINASVDAAGKFQLKNVPPGLADLRFSAPGLSAALGLSDLKGGDDVTIQVSLTSSSATIESDRRSNGKQEQLEGRVESLPPTTAAGSLVVAGRTVITNSSTKFYMQGQTATFADLALGQRVHVKGQTGTGGMTASSVDIQNTNTSTGLNVNGVVSGFSGTRSAFQFTVNGQLIKGDSGTEFYGNSLFEELMNGATVEVKGSQRDGYIYATRIHVNTEGIDFTGVITARPGTVPNLTLTIGPYTVLTTSETEVKRKGDQQTVAQLQIGQTVSVSGRLLPDGKVVASKISIEADAVGGLFEMEGNMGGESGSCPTLTFSVSGYVIKTDAATTITPSCGSLSNGSKVKVIGVVQADMSVKATSVQKQ